MEHTILVKAISANSAYRGWVYPSAELTQFKRDMAYLLPRGVKIPKGKLTIKFAFGLSGKRGDLDNAEKYCIDAIAKKYVFNDKRIYRIEAEKWDVEKGAEFITFEILPYARSKV
jgi:Holliday junction resolvase RusA-like endonuclease